MDALLNRLSHFKYWCLPGSLDINESDLNTRLMYERAYRYWKSFWTQVFIDNGDRRDLTSDDFMRQDLVTVITYQDEIVGMHLYSFFDLQLEPVKQHSYFIRSYNDIYMKRLDEKARTAMSWEYLTVDPKWRKSKTEISFAMVLIGLAAKIQKQLEIDVGIAVSRNDVKVTQMCEKYGAKIIYPNINLHNTPCDLISCFQADIKSPPDKLIATCIDILWNNRVELAGLENLWNLKVHPPIKVGA